MARNIPDIKKEATDRYIATPAIKAKYDLKDGKTFEDQFSTVSLESIIFFVVSTSIWTLEKLFDKLVQEVTSLLDNLKPHTARWYANAAKRFQFGCNLIEDSDRYDNSNLTAEQIKTSRIVAYSAVMEQEKRLLIKVAKEKGSDLEPLTLVEKLAFTEYISRIKDAGVQTEIISEKADNLRLKLKIHYNPLILDATGARLDGATLTPIADALHEYLKNLPFNGTLALAYLTDALQKVDGVVLPTIETAEYKYGLLDWAYINVLFQPYSGYMRIADADLTVVYEPLSEI